MTAQPLDRWADQAACAGSAADFHPFAISRRPSPDSPDRRRLRKERRYGAPALAVCDTCPVIGQCRDWARHDTTVGPWAVAGGETPSQRAGAPCWDGAPKYQTAGEGGGEHRSRKGHGEKGWDRGCRCDDCTLAHTREVARDREWRRNSPNPWHAMTPMQHDALLGAVDGAVIAHPRVIAALMRRELAGPLIVSGITPSTSLAWLTPAGTQLVQQHRKDTP